MIIGAAVALVMALVVVGGMALVSSLQSESDAPGTNSETAAAQPQQARGNEPNDGVYARIEIVKDVEIFAAAPNNGKVYWTGQATEGDIRNIIWKDLDLTIGDSSAVKMSVAGKRFPLPARKNLSIQFIEGKPSVVG
ncbi:hypothetical protein ABGB12_22450 [Actinocorallia sp. B10E7]|uniref:hypothetical protein n=1 Tax=Actinocorallia sp. B10E7 TaxID=3153558 RepID=UPI00325EC519